MLCLNVGINILQRIINPSEGLIILIQVFAMINTLFNLKVVKRTILFFVFILLLSGKNVFAVGVALAPDEEDKSVVIGTSFYSSADLIIPGNLDIRNSGIFQNNGFLYFSNMITSQIVLASGNLGAGEFVFAGTADCNLTIPSEQARVGKLQMNMSSGRMNLSGELAIDGKLELNSGIIHVPHNSILWIDNHSPDAVSFNDSPINKGYVSGFLTRNVSEGNRYYFPVGDAASFHPFLIDQPTQDDVVSISFDAAIPEEIRSFLPASSNEIESSFGWSVESDLAEQNTFLAGLSFLNTSLEKNASQLEVYRFSTLDLTGSAGVSVKDASYLVGTDLRSSGLYAFSNLLDFDLVNFIYVGIDNKTTFDIPGHSKYSNIRLSVFNHLGSVIFKSDHYYNEFDARNFPNGTYFYELELEKDNTTNTIRNFIDIHHEK